MQFQLDPDQQRRVAEWLQGTVYPELIRKRKQQLAIFRQEPTQAERLCWESGHPYTGAAGGGVTYSFSPGGLGTVVEVSYVGYAEKLNVTDYNSW